MYIISFYYSLLIIWKLPEHLRVSFGINFATTFLSKNAVEIGREIGLKVNIAKCL